MDTIVACTTKVTDSYLDEIFNNMFWDSIVDAEKLIATTCEQHSLHIEDFDYSDAAMINALPSDVRAKLIQRLTNFDQLKSRAHTLL